MTGRDLWARLVSLWCLAGTLVVFASPPAAAAWRWAWSDAAVAGLVVGGGLAYALTGSRPPVSPTVAATLALAALAEEIVWRWFALGGLAAFAGPGAALAATSLAFGLVHTRARRQHVVTGLAFGGVYLASGSLAGAWCAHCTYNLAVAAATARRPPPELA